MALQFQRNAKVYIVDTGTSPYTAWKVNVQEGMSFGQTVNSTEITINEAGETSRRARLLFNDSLAPAEWSFATYVRPFVNPNSPAEVRCPEEALWAMLMGADTLDSNDFGVFISNVSGTSVDINTPAPLQNEFNFNGSNRSAMADTWDIYVGFEESGNNQFYKLDQSVVNSATIDFDIEGIATIQWSGFAANIIDMGTTKPGVLIDAIDNGLDESCAIIRNRISTVNLVRTDIPGFPYTVVLTGGSFTIENNITYLTPEELGVVNQPCVNITGARSISGNLTCYLDNDTESPAKSGQLFADLVADTATVRNSFDMQINIGGETADTNRLVLDMPSAHIEIPAIGVEDLITLDIAFHGLVSNGDVNNTNEATIIYKV